MTATSPERDQSSVERGAEQDGISVIRNTFRKLNARGTASPSRYNGGISGSCGCTAAASCLPLLAEAVAYIGAGARRSVSRRVICLDAFPEALRAAHSRRCSRRGARGWTYATASAHCDTRRIEQRAAPSG